MDAHCASLASYTTSSGGCWAALPPELASHLSLTDARSLVLAWRDAPAVARTVLDGERRARCRLLAHPDVADLVRRVGFWRLCRAWKVSRHRPHAALCAQLERRLGRPLSAPTSPPPEGAVPFCVATCDAPGSRLFAAGDEGSGCSTLLRALAAVSNAAAGRRATVCVSPARPVSRCWWDAAVADVVVADAWCSPEPRLLVVDHLYRLAPSHMEALVERSRAGYAGDDAVAAASWCGHEHLARHARTVALNCSARWRRKPDPYGHGNLAAIHLDPPPSDAERDDLLRRLKALRGREWLVVDAWLRRWEVWTPPAPPHSV